MHCSSCGRTIEANYNRFENKKTRPLCSFCAERECKIYQDKQAEILRGFKLHWCKNCGIRININTFEKYSGDCSDCHKLRENQNEQKD